MPFQELIRASSRAHLATPYFTEAHDVLAAAKAGKPIDLLVGSSNLTQRGLFRNRRATVRFCALELYGTIRPTECPPINGRMAKALRYLGFDVRGA